MTPTDYQHQLEEDLQEETVQLSTALIASSDLDSVKQMETRMVEITTLIGQFSNLVQEQQEQIHEVHDAAQETKQNMDKGQENLVDATERTKQSKHYKAWLIFGMALILLFFHTLRN
jgi:t-SNARE complex subunit (syntaxin)